MKWNWTSHQIATLLNLPIEGPDLAIRSITTDSRTVGKGDLFVAIKGDSFDGHDFIPSAIASGASAILSEREGSHPEGAFLKVPHTLDAIRRLAHAYRRHFSIPLIGVVGAVGKTTTKELLFSILKGRYPAVLKTEGSQNGFLGIPLTLLQLKEEHAVGIIEIGIDEIGAMDQHLRLVEPTHLVLTRTGPEHLHQLKTLETAAEEELRAFDYGLAHSVPLAINLSDPFVKAWYDAHRSKLNQIPHPTYSLLQSDTAETTGSYNGESATLTVRSSSETSHFPCPLPGEHHAHNLLAAIVVGRLFGLTDSEILKGLSTFKTAYGRTEMYSLPDDVEVIGDYYNSNPTSLTAALKLLHEKQGASQYHAVLGDMLELGQDELRFHREASGPLRDFGITHAWLFGPRMKSLHQELKQNPTLAPEMKHLTHYDKIEDLAVALKAGILPHSRVLIKGSRGMKMERVLDVLMPGRKPS